MKYPANMPEGNARDAAKRLLDAKWMSSPEAYRDHFVNDPMTKKLNLVLPTTIEGWTRDWLSSRRSFQAVAQET